MCILCSARRERKKVFIIVFHYIGRYDRYCSTRPVGILLKRKRGEGRGAVQIGADELIIIGS